MAKLAWAAETPAEFEVVVELDRKMTLGDGTVLAQDVYRPAVGGVAVADPLPAILWRTPYNKRGLEANARYFAERGYVAVTQDVRGRYVSEGTFYPFAYEGPDGAETVEWVAAQPWCNGRVGTAGGSYLGAAQTATACHNPPHLAAMTPTFGPSSYYHSAMRHNGALEMRFFRYAFTMAVDSREAQADPGLKAVFEQAMANIWDWVRAYPIRRGQTPLALLPSYEDWLIDLQTRVCYDDYWQLPGYGPRHRYDTLADVPTLYIGGWYDSYTRSTLENFVALHPRQSQPVHVLMGPWQHSEGAEGRFGDLDFAPDGGLPGGIRGAQQRWFDRFLKDIDNGIEGEEPVRYFIMGGGPGDTGNGRVLTHGGAWHTAAAWPPPGTVETPWYLHADGSLDPAPPAGDPSPTAYTFDPADPVPTIGGNLSALGLEAGGFDQRGDNRFVFCKNTLPLASRADVLCFQTAPLAADLVVTGPIEARLWMATDGPDTDFTVKLIDVFPPSKAYPAGAAINLTDGIQRLRFRNGYAREEPAEPGTVYELRFQLYPTANRFRAGHRLRIDVSSSNYPRFDVNPNTGGPLGAERCRRVATNTLYHDAARPSQVRLHVVAGG